MKIYKSILLFVYMYYIQTLDFLILQEKTKSNQTCKTQIEHKHKIGE